MSAVAAQTVGKAALAQILGWGRPRLDRRLESDPHFPVVERGDQAGGWKFNPAAVKEYLAGGAVVATPQSAKPAPAPALDQAQLRDQVLPPPAGAATVRVPRRSARHEGEATAKQRKDAADAALRENKLRLENRELVPRDELRQVMAAVFASLGSDLDALPEQIVKLLSLPDETMGPVRELVDKARDRMVGRAKPLTQDE